MLSGTITGYRSTTNIIMKMKADAKVAFDKIKPLNSDTSVDTDKTVTTALSKYKQTLSDAKVAVDSKQSQTEITTEVIKQKGLITIAAKNLSNIWLILVTTQIILEEIV